MSRGLTQRRRMSAAMLLAAAALSLAAIVTASGCAENTRQTQVVRVDANAEDSSAITPIERGQRRREALEAARAGMDAWLAGDLTTMSRYFTDKQMDFYRKLAKDTASKGRERVRKHDDGAMEAIDMTRDGGEVDVRYTFKDRSYYTDRSGQVVVAATNTEKELQLTLERTPEGTWLIARIIGAKSVIE